MKYSIIIPTYNHCEDLLKPCIESIVKFSTMEDIELIIVANGCTDNTHYYLMSTPIASRQVISVAEPLGYTKATNLGIKQATGDYIILMNNDLVLLEQPKDQWLDMLVAPFADPKTGITGPVKFDWDCGGNTYACMAFWLVMIKKEIFSEIGILDEIYSPGMGEDGDFCIRTTRAGYNLVSVPNDVSGHFDTGIVNFGFPIYHVGNGTFNDNSEEKNAIIERNNVILAEKYGKKESNVGRWTWYQGMTNKTPYGDVKSYDLGAAYLRDCDTVEDWGCGTCFMSTRLDPSTHYRGIDGSWSKFATELADLVDYTPKEKSQGIFMRHVLEHDIRWKDILTNAVKNFDKKMVLVLFTPMSDTTHVIAMNDPIKVPDISFKMDDIMECLAGLRVEVSQIQSDTQYGTEHIFYINRSMVEISIVVPTYNHFEDAFKPCIDAILQYTDLSNKEVIVSANGCTDQTREYLDTVLKDKVTYVWFDEPVGYIRAVNAGIVQSKGDYVVLIDNDSILLPQSIDSWINILKTPFTNPKVGASSPFANEYPELGLVLHSGCTMYRTPLLRQLGMFDEIYNPGYFSDSDVSMKIWNAGFTCVEVPESNPDKPYINGVFQIQFPVVHTGQVQTMNKQTDNAIVAKNREIFYERYRQKVKYSIVIPTFNHCDDLLKPCIDTILLYTNMFNVEVIIVANGCVDNTREYTDTLPAQFKTIWFDEGLGYTKATNEGIKAATGEYIILMNNDIELLGQNKNDWLNIMVAPFVDPTVGITGILELYDPYADAKFPVGFCIMVSRKLFDKIGIMDEIFSPGYGEDIDLSLRAAKAGYKYVMVGDTVFVEGTNHTTFPIWHKNNQTFGSIPEYSNEIVKRNSLVLAQRYGKKMKKYSIVIPTYNQ